jgi:hypothetical protein
MPPTIEQHVEWISDCICKMKSKGLTCVETSEAASEAWQKEVDRAANATLLPKVKHSWYLGANVPGKPQVFMPYEGGFAHYRTICDKVASEDYKGFEMS